jgi:hypothetical protein
MNCTVKVVSSLVEFELAACRRLCRSCEEGCDLGRVHRLGSPGGLESLPKDRERIAARDDDTSMRLPAINKDAAVIPRNSLLLTPGSWFTSILLLAGDCSEESTRD